MKIGKQQKYKIKFRNFFEGIGHYQEPIVALPISKLEITNIEFEETKKEDIIKITLCRPGVLIGKGGYRIDKLTKYLSEDKPVKILIVESNLWR